MTGIDRFYIKRNTMVPAVSSATNQILTFVACRTLSLKPCKIWPFKILSEPKYGEPNQSVFDNRGNQLYIYADTMCNGLRYGTPTWDFRYTTIKEFTELALGVRRLQYKTTRPVASRPNQWGRQLFH